MVRTLVAVATLLLAWATLLCTAMIYASLKPIRQWRTWRVPVNFMLCGHASGALVVAAVMRGQELVATELVVAAYMLLAGAAVGKVEYWQFIRGTTGATMIEQPIGVAHGVRLPSPPGVTPSIMAARLFDTGHLRGTFLTREFVINVAASRRTWVLAIVWCFGFVLPMVWLAFGPARWQGAVLTTLACMIGMLAERWLFFADARHTVRLYHGERTS